jgi:hypothetical protein
MAVQTSLFCSIVSSGGQSHLEIEGLRFSSLIFAKFG